VPGYEFEMGAIFHERSNHAAIMTRSEELLCAIISGGCTDVSWCDLVSAEELVSTAFSHGLHLVLLQSLKKSLKWNDCPPELREPLEKSAISASVLDLLREQELRNVISESKKSGIEPILLKGVPLAHTLYSSPASRPSSDTDVLVRENEAERFVNILKKLGYEGSDITLNNLTSYQCLYQRTDHHGVSHLLDVHWKISNAQLFANILTFEELATNCIEIPALARARAVDNTRALLLACLHRFGHAHAPFYANKKTIYAGDHLRWVYDIHLICASLNTFQWEEFVRLATTKRVAVFCVDGLNATREAFGTYVPPTVEAELQAASRKAKMKAIKLRRSAATWFLANLFALPSLRQRFAFIIQTALPSPAYMLGKYQLESRLALPFFYGYRSAKGILKLLRRSKG
jgi:hypothetical protein